ncbi:recombinase RecT (plasmid) [Azospirillum sp. HJ39]|uniref:recombinase RecT n=1 Tax=Azospirillum sp. HJ39 TaxID=3159496 RepID=UPI0035586611
MASPSAVGMSSTPTKSIQELRAAGKEVARKAGGNTVKEFFHANKATLTALLPEHMKRNPDRMVTLALNCLRTTPKLLDCTLDSLFRAIIVCSQFGLEPNTPQGHIYLIPFENKRKKTIEVQIVIGYKGLIDLARRSGEIETITARVAYKGDEFSVEYGVEDKIRHLPLLEGEPGPVLGVYAVAKMKGGGYQFEWMSVAQVNRIRDESQGYKTAKRYNNDNTPWISNWEEMAKKTVIRRLCKYLPMSIEMANVLALDTRAEAGKTQVELVEGEFQVLAEDAPDDGDNQSDGDGDGDGEQTNEGSGPVTQQITQGAEVPMATVSNDTKPKASAERQQSAPRQPTRQSAPPPPADPVADEDTMLDPPVDEDQQSDGSANLFDE